MPIQTDGVIKRRGQTLEEFAPSFSEYLGAQWDITTDFDNPSSVFGANRELNQLQYEPIDQPPAPIYGMGNIPLIPKERLANEEVEQRALAAGVEIDIPEGGLTSGAADFLIDSKVRQRKYFDTVNRQPFSSRSVAGFGVQIAGSFLDPLNIGLAFVPVVGPAKYQAMLAKRASGFGRAATRAKVGIAEGAVGVAAFEPLNLSMHQHLQDDYSAMDSLLNITFGGLFGGGLHVGGGAIKDAYLGQWWKPSIPPAPAKELRNGVFGATTQVKIGDSYEPARWAVIDAEQLNATMTKADNQFRDRTRAASDDQIRNIANNIDFNLLGESPVMDLGAPTLSKDGLVIAGNGRAAAINLAHDIGTGQRYLKDLSAALDRFGIDPQSVATMNRPALVRILENEVDIRRAAISSNEGGSMRMSALEQAKVDAERLGNLNVFELSESGEINTAANRRLINAWVKEQPQSQRSALVDADGFLSVEGQSRLKNSILYKAFGDSETLTRLVESSDPGSKNIANALVRSAGVIAEARDKIRSGDLYDIDISADIKTAVEKISQLRAENKTVKSFFDQPELIDTGLSSEAISIMRVMADNVRAPTRISDWINNYYQLLQDVGNPKQGGLFESGVPTKQELMELTETSDGTQTAAQIVANASPAEREMATRVAVGQLMDGKMVEVEPVFDKSENIAEKVNGLESAKEKMQSVEAVRVADRQASESAAAELAEAPKTESLKDAEASLDQVMAGLDEQVKTINVLVDDPGARLGQRVANDFDNIEADYIALNNKELGLTSEKGRILNTDLMREMSPEYRADRSRSADVHEASSAAVKKLYAKKLAEPTPKGMEPTVLFTGGGTGAGKSSALEFLDPSIKNAEIIYDTNLNGLQSSIKKIDQALAAGRNVEIVYVYRDPVEALVNGALPRAERMGRTVPLKEHAKTHIQSNKTIRVLAEKYKDSKFVNIEIVDNSRGRGNAKPIMLDKMPELTDDKDLEKQLLGEVEKAYEQGKISESTYNGTKAGTIEAQEGGAGEVGGRSYQQESIADELKPYDDAIKSAEELSLAARAAAICDLGA